MYQTKCGFNIGCPQICFSRFCQKFYIIFLSLNSHQFSTKGANLKKGIRYMTDRYGYPYSNVPNRRPCTFINFEKKKSPLYGLILVCKFIDFKKKFPPARLFHPARLLVLVCSKFHSTLGRLKELGISI